MRLRGYFIEQKINAATAGCVGRDQSGVRTWARTDRRSSSGQECRGVGGSHPPSLASQLFSPMKKRPGVSFSAFKNFKNWISIFYWKNTFYTAKHIFPNFFSISFAI
jgi:hypothetical protein